MAAVGTHWGSLWEPRSTWGPAFMVSKAADAAVWEDLKDIRPPMYGGNPLNLDRFLEKLDNWWMTVTEDIDPAAADKTSSNGSDGAYRRCSKSCTLWEPKRGRLRPSRRPRSGSTSKSWWTPRRLPPRDGEPSSFRMLAGRSARGIGGTPEDNTSCSAETWRTGTRVMSSPACSISFRTLGEAGHEGGSGEGQEQPDREDDAQQGASQEGRGLDKSQSSPGLQEAVPAECPLHHSLRGSREGSDLAPGRE